MTRAILKSAGFSLVEIAMAVFLVALLVSIGVPSFATFMHNTQIRAGSDALLSGMQLARGEAVRRNTPVQFALNNHTGWTVATVAGEVLESRSENEGSAAARVTVLPADATRVTFSGFGRVVPNPDASEILSQITVSNPSGGECKIDGGKMRCLQVRVNIGGNVRMCDPSFPADDPRGC